MDGAIPARPEAVEIAPRLLRQVQEHEVESP
jgi:hypothetical protein